MTKVTKTEKILRKATGKWEKFLAEGAFNKAPVNEMTMGERGMVDAQDGNPPSKIGHGNEEYMAAYNTVMKKMGKEPLPIVKPDQKYLDALQRGNLQENNEMNLQSKAKGKAMGLLQTAKAMAQAPSHEPARGYAAAVAKGAGEIVDLMVELEGFQASRSASLEENEMSEGDDWYSDEHETLADKMFADSQAAAQEEQGFQVGEFVYVVNGSLKGASGKILEPVTTSTGEEGFAIELYSDAKKKVFGKRGDEVIAVAGDLESGGTTDDMELYDIDERSADDERDLEEPVKYGSGAELEFDKKAQKFYDRKRDMYIDDKEEEDNLTREDRTTMSSDPELDQIEDIARDMLEAGIQNSRIPVGLNSVASALKVQGFDATVSSGVLNIDGKYFMGKKENFDISPDEDVRQLMGYVLGYMG